MATLNKADLEKIIDEQTAEIEKLKLAASEGNVYDKDKQIADAVGEAARLAEDNQKLRDELDAYTARAEEEKKAFLDGADEINDLKMRADTAEITVSQQREELDALRHSNSDLREKVTRLERGTNTLHGHIDDLKAPY